MTTNSRLRNQPVTVKPRITMLGDTFKVDYFGTIVKEHCGVGFPTFEQAVDYANMVAKRHPASVSAINQERAAARRGRILRSKIAKELAAGYEYAA